MYNLLLVEDNEDIQDLNKFFLTQRGYDVRIAMNLAEAKEAISNATDEAKPDLIVLDIMLPDGNGLDFLKELRAGGNYTPVLLLTALSETSDEMRGMQEGGDDYIAKPYENDILHTRIEALLRRAERVPQTIKKGTLLLESYSSQAYISGESLGLTAREYSVLLFLVQNEGRLLAADFIYGEIWKQPLNEDKNAAQTIISRLRKKIEPSGYSIETHRNKGYTFTKL